MVDVPSAKTWLVVVTFLGIYSLLASGFIASGLTTESMEFREPIYEDEYWGLDNIEQIATTANFTMGSGGGFVSYDWGIDEGFGHNMLLQANIVSGEIKIQNEHYYLFLIFPYGHHSFEWISKTTGVNYGEFLNETEFNLVSETSLENITSASFTLDCGHVVIHSVVGFNYTTYANASMAFLSDELIVEFGIEWDELGTGLNAWNILTSILFFQAPDIHWLFNAILAVPLWACIAWLAYALITVALSVLPFT